MGEPGSARSTPPGGTPVGEDGLQLRRMGQSAGVLGTSDVFVFRRVTGSRFVHVGGTGRARGWAGGVEMDVDTDPLGSQLRVGRPVWVRHTYPRRIFGPYYAAVAVAVRLSRDVLVVFGAPTTEGGVSLELTAAEVVAAAGVAAEFVDTVTPAKYLVDELQMLHASRALATRRGPGGSVAEVLGDVAQVAAEALSCELAIAWLPDGRCHVHESGWTLPEQGRPLVEAIMRELWDARDRFPPVVQDAADTPLTFPLDPDSGVRSYYTLPIGAPPSALLLVAHTDADPRGFTQHCLTLGEQLAVTADTGVATAVLREQLLYAVAEESSARQEVVNANIELGKVNAELSEAALHDPLTGLANRVLLQRHAQRLGRWHTPAPPAGAGEATPTPVLLYIDLDNFKSVNDDYGHAVGDGVLVEFARRLRESCRPHDVAARLAGDEFVLLMTEPLTDVQALAVANRLVRAASIPFLIADTTITIGASVGIVTVAGNDDGAQPPLEGWLHRADLAMYRAKTRGRGRAEIFTNRTTAPKITHTRRWADDPATGRRLRAALDEGVLRLRYQPTVDLVTGEVLGVQAVIHWPQPPGPAVRPAELVPFAERTGLIGPLGEWALREACRQAAVWNTQRPAHTVGPVMIVNVSTTQLSDPEFGELVGTVIGETALPPGRVGLEIAQPTTGTDQEELVAVLDVLRESGVRLTVGGYGAGSSSLTVLRHLPLDWVKIDEELVGRVDVEPTDAVLVRLVIESAHSLGVRVCAEGVDRHAQLEQLAAMGCDAVQGPLLGGPVDAALLDTRTRAVRALLAPGASRPLPTGRG